MVIVYFGDVVGATGRRAVEKILPDIQAEYGPDVLLANAENLAGGRGISKKTYWEMKAMGFHGMTSGNHVWANREILSLFETEKTLFRPANFPSPAGNPCPGMGYGYVGERASERVFVINLLGRTFMDDVDDPFATVDRILETEKPQGPILVDMHCEATAEKAAMAWYLAGKVSAVVGSHTHVQTADERILPGGTAFITDVGMSGSFDSVIGLETENAIHRFRTRRPTPFHQARGNPGVGYVAIRVDRFGRAESIERHRKEVAVELTWGEQE